MMIAIKDAEHQDWGALSGRINISRGEAVLLPRPGADNLIVMTEDDFLEMKDAPQDDDFVDHAHIAAFLNQAEENRKKGIKGVSPEELYKELEAVIDEVVAEKNAHV